MRQEEGIRIFFARNYGKMRKVVLHYMNVYGAGWFPADLNRHLLHCWRKHKDEPKLHRIAESRA